MALLEAHDERRTGSLRASAVRGGAIFLAARLGTQLVQIVMTLAVVRLLLPADYGLMAVALACIGLADILSEAGISRALVQRRELTEDDVAQALALSVLLAVTIYGVLLAISAPLARHLGMPQLAPLLNLCGAAVLLVPFASVAVAKLERELQYGVQSLVTTASALVQGLLVLALALAGWGVWSLAAGLVAARVVQCAGTCWAAGLHPRLAWPTARSAGLIRFGLSVSGTSLIWLAYTNADIAVISATLGAAAAGAYSVALLIAMMPVDKVSSIINQVAYAAYCRLQDDRSRMRDWFARLMVMRALVIMPMLIGLALVAHDAVPLLLGEQWRPAVRMLQLLAPVACLMVVSTSFAPLLNALGHPEIALKYTIANAIVLPIAFLIGCRLAGTLGVCLAWLVIFPVLLAGLIHMAKCKTGIGVRDVIEMLRPVMHALTAMIIVVLTVQLWLLPAFTPALRLVISVGVGIAAFASWILMMAPAQTRTDLLQVLKDLRPKAA